MPPKITVIFDTERSYLSVAHLIRRHVMPNGAVISERSDNMGAAGEKFVVRVRCRSFADVQNGLYTLKRGKLLDAGETSNLGAVGCDTLSRLADITRRAVVNNQSQTDEYFDLWAKRDSLHTQIQDWGHMTGLLAEFCAKASAYCEDQNIPFIIGAHERLAEDPMDNKAIKGGMDFNGKLLSEVEENSDYVWRTFREDSPIKIGTVQYPAGTHFLQTMTSAKRRTKVRLPQEIRERLGEFRPNPNLVDVFEIMGIFRPNVLSLFGGPGSGKTTLMTSLSDPKNYQATK